ncbi:unnamed protein product [Thlaspi arvense]|uniref:Uncharacterized protein n=1 Tax=Thlaspi arvense TaxID=13288 RepID=A0AAU9S5G7_THLAR|nr:unnamed protein product [Thlaspi arvense]
MKEVVLFLVLLVSVSDAQVTKPNIGNFLECLTNLTNPENPITEALSTPDKSTFVSFYESYTKKKTYSSNPNVTKPIAIVAAKHESHVQATVICSKSNGIQIQLFVRAMPQITYGAKPGDKTIAVKFYAQFLGSVNNLMEIINKNLLELGLKREDCYEMSWLNTTMFWEDYPVGASTIVLLERPSTPLVGFLKNKSDYVKKPIPKEGIENIWETMLKFNDVWMQWNPYGGVMDQIPENATAFPHRRGNLFKILYFATWCKRHATDANLSLMKELYQVTEPYVTSNPREAYLNYRDIDVGSNRSDETSVDEAQIYG